MKQLSALAMFAMAWAAMLAGCATSTEDTSELSVSLVVGNTDVTSVSFEITCDSGFSLSGEFNVNDEQDPPIWAAVMDVPVGDCTITITAFDDTGAVLCAGSADFTVVADQTVKVDLVLTCGEVGDDEFGNVEIDATFEIIDGNTCPSLHLLNVVPDEIPAEGSAVAVSVSDADGDPLTTVLTATGGSFADPSSDLTIYTCDDASGAQTISVTVSDGDTACDKSKSFGVTCPGVSNLCEGVVCPNTGNDCTVSECNPENGECGVWNVDNGTACDLGGGGDGELTDNGDFESGDISGWTDFSAPNMGTFMATTAQANGGSYSGNLVASVPPAGGFASFPVVKQANIGIGTVSPNSPLTVSFDLFGSLAGTGGVVFVEFFSELDGGGTSKAEILSGGPLFPVAPNDWQAGWVSYSFNVTTGPDVSGGVTLQLKADCGANPGCTVNTYWDNVSVVSESGVSLLSTGGAGMCMEGVCVPTPECVVDEDCPDGTCNEGVCETSTSCEYTQDFESLDQASGSALGDDGWLIFGAVFNPAGDFLFGYGSFPAPNGTPGFSSVAAGEGGPGQGAQQLVIYSDYDNGDAQNAGNRVQANTFQERTIVAGDVSTTITFSFDAKRGDIGGASVADAFIKTLDPNAGFATTRFIPLVTTGLPTDWARYSLSLAIDASLVGQILQVGYSATATNFEPSGTLYDNIEVCSEPTP